MKKELTPKEVIFDLELSEKGQVSNIKDIKEFKDPYKKIKRALNIKKEGYNLYLIDSFAKDKVDELVHFIQNEYRTLEPPSDICYVTLKNNKKPFAISISNGRGSALKEELKNLKEEYIIATIEFYNASSNEEKDEIVENVHSKRNKYIGELMDLAKDQGFEVKVTTGGFAFIPLEDGEVMTEKIYDELQEEERSVILDKASKLKSKAEYILEKLKELEVGSLERLKEIFEEYLEEKMRELKEDVLLEFITDDEAYNYLENFFNNIEDDLVENYNIDLEEEDSISEIVNKYEFEVIVDNSEFKTPRVIYEDDPNLINLLGNIEYESKNGNYITDLSLITAGSLLKANGGCLILRLNNLISNVNSYYYLKKILLSGKLNFDSNRNYLELLSINGLKPEPVDINLKVIIIGDYESYNILYNNDEDFRKLFPLKCEIYNEIKNPENIGYLLKNYVMNRIKVNKIKEIEEDAIKEILRYLVRQTSNRNKINLDNYNVDKILILSNEISNENKEEKISKNSVRNLIYEEDFIEDDYIDMYRNKKILINIKGKAIGNINGLAVLDTGTHCFGKPLRITCVATKGEGRIVDIHKESKLSGKIHEKSIKTLYAILTKIVSEYETPPVDLHLSFEQSYGLIEGDSASVAEMIAILSAISKRSIFQNIAVTGSLNQFGEVQPIGGVNEKIEGFFNICKELDSIEGKGVLIPSSNKDELILNPEVEKAIKENKFHLYEMTTLDDAIETLILEENEGLEEFYRDLQKELKKYK